MHQTHHSRTLLEVEMWKKCTPLWREAHFQVKMHKNTWASERFWKLWRQKSGRRCGAKHISKPKCTKHTILGPLLEVEMSKKWTPLWRSTFRSQNLQNTRGADHFWHLRCRKSASSCGAKHISKSKCTKHTTFGPLLEVPMWKKCTPLWREAQFEVKSAKNWRVWSTFWTFRCFVWQAQGIVHLVKSEQNLKVLVAVSTTTNTTLDSTPLQLQLQYYTTLHYTQLHYTTLHYTTLHYTTTHKLQLQLHYITLHYATEITLQYTTLITLHSISLHYLTLLYTTLQLQLQLQPQLHYSTLRYTNYITLH